MFVNLTPHSITIRTPEGDTTIPPSGSVARVATTEQVVGEIAGAPVVRRVFGEVQGLPDPEPDTIYIVSGFVREALGALRPDVMAPDTGPTAVRDQNNRIIAVTRLVGVPL